MKKRLRKAMIVLGIIIGVCIGSIGAFIILALKYNGTWIMEGYGFGLDIKAGYARVYEVTDTYYTRSKVYDGVIISGVLYSGLGKFELRNDKDRLSLLDKGAQNTYKAYKASEQFIKDKKYLDGSKANETFHMFYEMFEENYAFAKKYGVDLTEEYRKYQSLINENTTEEELYQAMCDMVSKLKDGHVEVYWEDKEYSPCNYKPEWIIDKAMQKAVVNNITDGYIKDYYKFEDCHIRYGSLREDIGYILIHALGMEELNKSASTKKAMDRIIKEFNSKDTIVFDLRFCSGGFDEASLLISGYFTDAPYLAYKKHAFSKNEYTELQSIYVKPNQLRFQGNLVIITSGYTISAGETLARDLLANPDHKITVIGERTAGFYSDGIPKILQGDFSFTMSSEKYYWYDNTELEGVGIEPDIYIPVDVDSAKQGIDKAFDWILDNY